MIQTTQTNPNAIIASKNATSELTKSKKPLTSLNIRTPLGSTRGPEPIRQGVPLSQGAVYDETKINIADSLGRAVVSQVRVLSRWSDGSVQWLLVDFLHTISGFQFDASDEFFETNYFVLTENGSHERPRKPSALQYPTSTEPASQWGIVDVGNSQHENSFFRIGQNWNGQLNVRLIDGRSLEFKNSKTRHLESGPVRTVIEMCGELTDSNQETILDCRFELHMFAELKLLRCTLTLCNPLAAKHPGGIWELGDSSSVEIEDASIVLKHSEAMKPKTSCAWSVDGSHHLNDGKLPFSLYQDSSGGEAWNCSNHVDRNGAVPLRFRGFELSAGELQLTGERATPVVEYQTTENDSLAVSMPQFWQNFPKSISLENSELRIGLFPAESKRPHELQGGEQKTHQFWIGGRLTENVSAVAAVHQPSDVSVDPSSAATSAVMPWLTPKSEDSNSKYLSLVDAAIEGEDNYFQKRETIDEYGWRHFGDIYGDHEAVFSESQPPLISHYNNQYDVVLGFGIQFLRAGDQRWIEMMRDLAWHVVDIDIYHAATDKNAYNGGQFWHTFHYIDAGKANHRSYPKGTCGGGPASEQGYARGLGLYYFLTGEEMMRQVVDRMGEWIISADDGSRTPFRYLSNNGTGLTSASGTLEYQGPGRGAGNAIELSVAAFEVTGKRKFLDEAEKLIQRVIHPNDDIESRNLLDAERRWYYNLFLQSLGRYLWVKHQHGEHDSMYGYARTCLLHYAKWMIDNEYPYLTKPEILEHPTETWAAQDMRKCEVFQWASLHAGGELRESLLERAKFFFDYSTETLSTMETRTLCRPIALLLSNGYSRAWFENHNDIPKLPQPTNDKNKVDFGMPQQFVPQKIQAIKRAKAIFVCGAIAGLLAVGVLAWRLFQ